MPPITMLLKPASGSCNLRCEYCFYADEMRLRETPCYGVMSERTLENVIKKAMRAAEGTCSFTFQGGEPMLAGIDFFRNYMALIKRYARLGLTVNHAIQTNGTLIDGVWADFFKENNFLVGLSLDGPAKIHDRLRKDEQGSGSFDRVWRAKECLERHGVEFNILSVITEEASTHAGEIYDFFVSQKLLYQQYIPCLKPMDGNEKGEHALTAGGYARFLCDLFDRWYEDYCGGKQVYIRYFENIAGMLLGYPPENCGMCGRCVNQYVVEADGSVYPCDFYVLDGYRLGNLNEQEFVELDRREREIGFIDVSLREDPICRSCEWRDLCRGGCRRDRQQAGAAVLGRSCYCESYKRFFEHAVSRLVRLVRELGR